VIGLSLARELARHGMHVRVIDRQEAGREASWAGAGILPPANRRTAVDPLDHLRGLSYELHGAWAAELLEETGIDNGFRVCGGIYLARSAGEAASLLGLEGLLAEQQIAALRLSPAALAEVEPGLGNTLDQIRAAYLLPGEAQLRNPRHLKALLASCRQRGVEVSEHCELLDFECAGGEIRGVQTSQGKLTAESYCLTSGAWTRSLLERLEIANGVFPVRGQMVLFRCELPSLAHIINEGPRYLVPRDDGRVLVGSTEEEVGFDKRNTEEAVAELSGLARELVPALRHAPIEQTWAGLRPASFDGLPYLGRIPGLANAFVSAGHFRTGLYLSTGTAVVLSDLIRGKTPEIDLAPFRVGRG
jgi:glycine oxidase